MKDGNKNRDIGLYSKGIFQYLAEWETLGNKKKQLLSKKKCFDYISNTYYTVLKNGLAANRKAQQRKYPVFCLIWNNIIIKT